MLYIELHARLEQMQRLFQVVASQMLLHCRLSPGHDLSYHHGQSQALDCLRRLLQQSQSILKTAQLQGCIRLLLVRTWSPGCRLCRVFSPVQGTMRCALINLQDT